MPLPFNPDSYPTPMAAALAVCAPAVEDKGLSRPLDNETKWRLVRVAQAAWDVLMTAGKIPAGVRFEAWRKAEARKATGGVSISEASVKHEGLIQGHFLRLKGDVEAAQAAEERTAVKGLEIARNALKRTLRENRQDWQAARTIAGRFYKGTELRDLTAKQVWSVVYTLRNNASAAKGRGSKEGRFKTRKAKAEKRAKGKGRGAEGSAPESAPAPAPAPWLL